MPAGYAATTGVESTYGDSFTFEISDLRVAERVPSDPTAPPADVNVLPGQNFPAESTRRPSNIVPINPTPGDPPSDVFYLGLDVTFVGTQLGQPGMPQDVDLEVRFYLEGYGAVGPAGTPERHEINIQPQLFTGLNADPTIAGSHVRHQLWVEVWEGILPDIGAIIEAPSTNPPNATGQTWEELFTPETIYRVAASVKIDKVNLKPSIPPAGAGFIEGAVMNTIEAV